MTFRKLQIAWSVMCGIAFVLLIALWVRSHWWHDMVTFPSTGMTWATSFDGEIGISHWPPDSHLSGPSHWKLTSISAVTIRPEIEAELGKHRSGWYCYFTTTGRTIGFPHWFPILLFAAFATTPWTSQRFSLRTMLIGTTLFAVVLGLLVFATR